MRAALVSVYSISIPKFCLQASEIFNNNNDNNVSITCRDQSWMFNRLIFPTEAEKVYKSHQFETFGLYVAHKIQYQKEKKSP